MSSSIADTQIPQLVGQFTILVHRNAVIVGHLDVVQRVVDGVRFSIEQPSDGVGFVLSASTRYVSSVKLILFDLEDWHGSVPLS